MEVSLHWMENIFLVPSKLQELLCLYSFCTLYIQVTLTVIWFAIGINVSKLHTINIIIIPWSFAMISTFPCMNTPTHEYVVPRSMPTAFCFGGIIDDVVSQWIIAMEIVYEIMNAVFDNSELINVCIYLRASY